MSRPLLIIDAATLSPAAVESHAPNLRRLSKEGSLRPLAAPFPGLTCPSHATLLTGSLPEAHGLVGNGWYERAHAKIFMWNRSAHLLTGEPLWEAARQREPGLRCANLFFRHAADSSCDVIATERPVYWSSGRKSFDFYTSPPTLHDPLVHALGSFPFQQFWGPLAGVASTRWIIGAALHVMKTEAPELLLVYAPFTDYDAERYGARSDAALRAVQRFDAELAPLLDAARAEGRDVALVSDYGWDDAEHPVYINRALREAGLLDVEVAANGERLQPGTSRAFAVVDSQIAHVYVQAPGDRERVAALLRELPGIADVIDSQGQRQLGIAHARSGDLIAVAKPRHWFAYRYWLDNRMKPDFAHCIAIFDKIGWDPTELFMRAGLLGKARFGVRSVQKLLRLAVPFDVCAADDRLVGGTRAARCTDPSQGAALVTSWPLKEVGSIPMQHFKQLMLDRMFGEA